MDRTVLLMFVFGLAAAFAGPLRAADFPDPGDLPERPVPPDPFTLFDGSKVSTPADWNERRRPELIALFQHYMYGVTPAAPGIVAREEAPPAPIMDGRGLIRQFEIRFEGLPDEAPRIHLALLTPDRKGERFPVFLALNACGNHTVHPSPALLIRSDAWVQDRCHPHDDTGRGAERDFWCAEYLIERGYGFATFHQSDIDPDRNDFTDGIHPWYPDLPGPADSHWVTISAWAWGLHRAVDFLVTDPMIDPERICVTGHSRRGKTALLAGALDERIALTVPHQSGTGGCALSRANDQETVERINRVFPHWFNGNFKKFNDAEARLPFDQHLLVSLVAPRLLLDTEGLEDRWANYESGWGGIRRADSVWKFLGRDGHVGSEPLVGTAGEGLSGMKFGELAQFRLDTRHTLNRDYWIAILDFADHHFKR